MADASVTGAVDIGGTKIAVGLVDRDGHLLQKDEMPTDRHGDFARAMEQVKRMLTGLRRKAGVQWSGIGIGCTGPVDPIAGVVGRVEFLPGWEGANPVEYLQRELGVTVAMENDADAAVLAEATWGVGRGKSSVVCVTIGTGIGAGVVLDGALYRGVQGIHPEIGHHVIDSSGPRCFCGARGCWEVLARGPAMVERLRGTAADAVSRNEPLTAKKIFALARDGVPEALEEVEREGTYLGIGVANLITFLSPEVIVLGGSVMRAADLLLPIIRMTVNGACGLVDPEKTVITSASLGPDTPLIGAGMVWRHRYEKEKQAC